MSLLWRHTQHGVIMPMLVEVSHFSPSWKSIVPCAFSMQSIFAFSSGNGCMVTLPSTSSPSVVTVVVVFSRNAMMICIASVIPLSKPFSKHFSKSRVCTRKQLYQWNHFRHAWIAFSMLRLTSIKRILYSFYIVLRFSVQVSVAYVQTLQTLLLTVQPASCNRTYGQHTGQMNTAAVKLFSWADTPSHNIFLIPGQMTLHVDRHSRLWEVIALGRKPGGADMADRKYR